MTLREMLDRINKRAQRKWYAAIPEEFLRVRDQSPRRAFLSYHTPGELREHVCMLSEDRTLGFSICPRDGEISNVFNLRTQPGSAGRGGEAVNAAIECGGYQLNCFDGFLPEYYRRFGFEETSRVAFDRNLAPAEWDYAEYGEPDVVYMSLKPEVRRQFDPQ